MAKHMYAGYPTVKLFANKGDDKNIHELLWGDWVKITGEKSGGWYPVYARGEKGWIRASDLMKDRILEIIFVDVGQGDGCLIVTPKDKHIIVDAGVSDNMYRYLKWRYSGFRRKWTFEAAVITHPDKDHYNGFTKLFNEKNVYFNGLFHNGIVETKSKDKIGKSKDIGEIRYITELMETKSRLKKFLDNTNRWKGKLYPGLLNVAMKSGRIKNIEMLSTAHGDEGYLPGYTEDKDFSIRILGPVVETDDDKRSLLRWFRKFNKKGYDTGQTKNGHSILMKLKFHEVSILLSGDLNWAAEHFLLKQHVQRDIPGNGSSQDKKQAFIQLARDVFECDVIKSCHHGSADFMNLFLQACNPIATIVSSGDEESHSHPRSDTLGAIGKFGRGERPLIFSTELARSTREVEPSDLQKKLRKKQIELVKAKGVAEREKIKVEVDDITDKILTRNVTVYGAINLRTDGHRVIISQKLERDRSTRYSLQKWDVYKLERDENGDLHFVNSGH